jgi:hypothetical protein
MLTWLRSLFRRPDPPAEFRAERGRLLAEWFRTAAASGKPKGLRWVSFEPLGEPLFGPGAEPLGQQLALRRPELGRRVGAAEQGSQPR